MKDIIGDYESFIQSISDGLNTIGVDRAELSMMDHICYRVETEERYQELLKLLQVEATLLGESEVSGRQIATFEFNDYPQVDGWTVPYLELPAPKEGSAYAEGLKQTGLSVKFHELQLGSVVRIEKALAKAQ